MINPEKIFYWLAILSTLFGGVAWLTNIDSKATTAFDQTAKINDKYDEIIMRLTRIEDRVRERR